MIVCKNGSVLKTLNGGVTWTHQWTSSANSITGIAFADANAITLVGAKGTILRTTTGGVPVGVNLNDESSLPSQYVLQQNYPNPFNPITMISYVIPKASYVRLFVYDILGQRVASLVDEFQEPGAKFASFDATRFASGIYFYALEAGIFRGSRKMIFVK